MLLVARPSLAFDQEFITILHIVSVQLFLRESQLLDVQHAHQLGHLAVDVEDAHVGRRYSVQSTGERSL